MGVALNRSRSNMVVRVDMMSHNRPFISFVPKHFFIVLISILSILDYIDKALKISRLIF